MAKTRSETIRDAVQDHLSQLVLQPGYVPDPPQIQSDLLSLINRDIEIGNNQRPQGQKWRFLDQLEPEIVADVICTLYPVINLSFNSSDRTREYTTLAIYQEDGPDRGIYSTDTYLLYNLIRSYNYQFKKRDVEDTLYHMKMIAPLKYRTSDRNLIAVNNGVFDFDTKELTDFSPDYVFTSKCQVDYVAGAVNPVITNPKDGTTWDIESWMDDLFDDPDLTRLAWQIIGANIRPNVKWEKCAWFYSNTGENGKGTLCELMRQIAGPGTYASIPLSNFAKDFMLEPLIRASSIICDENDVGGFIDKSANLKAVITNDPIQMNRKHQTPLTFIFKGFMVQCVNELPKVKDRSDSFTRRFLIIKFAKCFTGAARKYIKDDYVKRKDVLEYVLHRVLHMDYYKLDEPVSCMLMMNEYKEYNDPIRQFVAEVLPVCQWDLLPYTFLYSLYSAWFRKTSPAGTLLGRNKFIMDLQAVIMNSEEWAVPPNNMPVRPANRMSKPEPLLKTYDLKEWMNQSYTGGKDEIRLVPSPLKTVYKGIVRNPPPPPGQQPGGPGTPPDVVQDPTVYDPQANGQGEPQAAPQAAVPAAPPQT